VAYADEKSKVSEEKHYLDIASILLKDTGIKTKIIRQYLPVINKLVNKYLVAMDFFCHFELDETFNEKIKSRHRDEFSYASFSEGEKQRIDLALVFTWRTIAKMKNCASTNLLLLDEVFDSSLDANGTDYVMNLINTLGEETNVFVISHKGDLLFDKFRSIIKFEKHQNFSRITT
jgi:DNA repair exonuclease SbcCD ATPase subunit